MSGKTGYPGRRATLFGGAVTALSLAAGCANTTTASSLHNGRYHFTMPAGQKLDDLLARLGTALGGPARLEKVVDLGKPSIDAENIVTVQAPTLSTADARNRAEQISQDLGLADFEADIEVKYEELPTGICLPVRETPLRADTDSSEGIDAPNDLAWSLRSMNVRQAWALSRRMGRKEYGEGVVIGHIDTGVTDHVELEGAMLLERSRNFVEEGRPAIDSLVHEAGHRYLIQPGHGTSTASVIVSRGEIGDRPTDPKICHGTIGPGRITGSAPKAMLLPVRAIHFTATSDLLRIANAINFLRDEKVGVMTMAIGWPFGLKVLESSLKAAVRKDIIVLAAAGNFYPHVVFPAKYDDCIAIGAVGPDDEPWCGSPRGSQVAVCAPGDKVWRAIRSDPSDDRRLIGPRYGTSFAVSLTAGVAALWLAHHDRDRLIERLHREKPGKTLQDAFRGVLCATARRTARWSGHEAEHGKGIVDAAALLAADPLGFV